MRKNSAETKINETIDQVSNETIALQGIQRAKIEKYYSSRIGGMDDYDGPLFPPDTSWPRDEQMPEKLTEPAAKTDSITDWLD